MKKYSIINFLFISAIFFFSGCASTASTSCAIKNVDPIYRNNDFSQIIKKMSDDLVNCKTVLMNKDLPIIFTTFVDLNNFDKTSNFGRMISETLMSEMAQKGLRIIDYRTQSSLMIKKQKGEFILNRMYYHPKPEIRNAYIVIGTYSRYGNNIVINARLIDNKSGVIISSSSIIVKNLSLLNEICSDGICGKTNHIKINKIEKTMEIQNEN